MRSKIVSSIINILIAFLTLTIFLIFYKAYLVDPDRKLYFLSHLFFLLPVVLFTFFVRFQNKNFQENYIITIVMSLICIYSFEFFTYSQMVKKNQFQFNENIRAAKKLNVQFDDRNFDEVFEELQKKDKKPFPSVVRDLLSINGKKVQTFGTLSNRFILMCNESGKWITYNSDRYGFNNPDKVWDNNIDILILGDSSGEGQCVDQSKNFASSIRNSKNINAAQVGGSGMGSMFEYALYKEFLQNKKIENLVIFFLLNDLDNLKSEKNNPILMSYMNQENYTQNIFSKKSEIDRVMEDKYFKKKRGKKKLLIKRFIKVHHTRDYIKRLVTKEGVTLFSTYYVNDEMLEIVIDVYKKIRTEYQGNLYIGYVPDGGSFIGTDAHKQKLKEIRLKIIKKLRENQFNVLDFYETLSKEKVDEILPFGKNVKAENHYSEYGHEIIANYILKNLK